MPQVAAAAPPADELLLWRQWREAACAQSRGRLLDLHLPYARVVAASLYARRFHDEIGFEDYLQLARLGMLECLERFDPSHGVLFRTFAARRMRGAILDGIERLTEKQQQIGAHERLRAHAGAEGDTGAPLPRWLAQAGLGGMLSWLLEDTGMVRCGEPTQAQPFYREAARRQLRQGLLRAIEQLNAQERAVVRGHYLQAQSFHDIATRLGRSRSRISQIHTQALHRLRAALDGCAGLGLDD